MWENQNPYTPAEPEVAPKPTYEELEQAVSNLNDKITKLLAQVEYADNRTKVANAKIKEADDWITEELDGLTQRQVRELCEALGLDSEITKSITVQVEFELEITAERGFAFDDLDEGSFNISIEPNYGNDWSISSENYSISDVSVDD